MRREWTNREVAFLKENAGKLTATDIGHELSRTRGAVHAKAKSLGIRLTQYGEYHWKSRLSELRVQMLCALRDAGYSAEQIKQAFGLDVHVFTINDATSGRTWRG